MLKVLLVDDEAFIRQGLAVLIDWEKEGYYIAGETANGKEAVEFLRKEKVDLIISDIKMPEMNGIELLQMIREEKISTADYILLSGFYEFSYAKSAIRNNCSEYILKPVQKEELIDVVRRIKKRCEQTRIEEDRNREKEKALLDRNLMSLIWGKYDEINLDYVHSKMRFDDALRYINIEIDSYDERFKVLSETQKHLEQRKLYYTFGMILGEEKQYVIFDVTKHEDCYDLGFLFCGFMAEGKQLTEKEYFTKLFNELTKQFPYRICMHVGSRADELKKISDSYHAATVAKSFQSFRNDRDIAYYEETLNNKSGTGLEKQKLDHLIQAVEMNEKERIAQCVEEIYADINTGNMDYQMVHMNINYILLRFIHLAAEQDDNVDQEAIMRLIGESAFDAHAIRGSSNHFTEFTWEFADYIQQLRQNASRGVLGEIEKEIEQTYMENISLKTLSEKYYINSAYLGQIFKKQFGMPFKSYLNILRIEKASEMLIRTDEKVYIVADAVGYRNLDYFINKFVELKGCTPAKYRKAAWSEKSE